MNIGYKSMVFILGVLLSLTTYQTAYANNLGISDAQINALLSISASQQLYTEKTKKPQRFNIKVMGVRVINGAMKMLNVPYVWGGTSPRGFDCSGLVQYIYRNEGISLPRTAAQQYKAIRKIKREYVAKGDLIFFHMRKRGVRIDHVGIYIGNNQFIHAPRRGKNVSVSKLSSFWKKKIAGIGRAI
jgi:cell wall-associated NlpC family hydrolase